MSQNTPPSHQQTPTNASTEAQNQALAVVKRHQARFTSPPKITPRGLRDDQAKRNVEWGANEDAPHWTTDWGFSIDAPLLGNGDLIGALAGDAQWPQIWLTTNDFWDFKSDGWVMRARSYGGVGPRPLGRFVFAAPALAKGQMVVEQDFATATTVTRIVAPNNNTLELRSWIAATENLLVVELRAQTAPIEVRFSFKFPTEVGLGVDHAATPSLTRIELDQGAVDQLGIYDPPHTGPMHSFPTQSSGWSEGTFWATRTYAEDVDQPAMLAVAARFLDQTGAKVVVTPGAAILFVAAVRSWQKTIQPLQTAHSRATWLAAAETGDLRQWHEAWWRRYWNISFIEIDDPLLEQRYYLSHYVMGSLSRDPEFPPSIFGVQTWDDPGWCGDYKINYNHQSPFLGLYTAGRFEQADPHDAPYLAALDRGREMARRLLGHGGAHFPLGLGPKGLVCENGTWGMKSHNIHGLLNIALRWYLSYDESYAWKVYPLIRAGVDFWEGDLRLENGRYTIEGDTAHETDGDQMALNPLLSLGYVRAALRLAISVSSALGVDLEKQPKWQEMLAKMSDYPLIDAAAISSIFGVKAGVKLADLYPAGALAGKKVFMLEEIGSQWSFKCAGNLAPVYPAGEIGFDSPPELLQVARDTVYLRSLWAKEAQQWCAGWSGDPVPDHMLDRGAWTDFNTSSLFFPMAVRVGFDPETIWQELRQLIELHGRPNGFLRNNPHGIENCSTVPNTLHEMMLLSHEHILRFFKVWPRRQHPNARFVNLRAFGDFIVSAGLIDGEVANIRIESLAGRDCQVENPWPGQEITLWKDDNPISPQLIGAGNGKSYAFPTQRGAIYRLQPQG